MANKTTENYKCEPCDKRFYGIIPFQQHNVSEKHQKKIRALESTGSNSAEKQNDNILHCKPCGKKFAGHVPHSQHLASEKHLKKIHDSSFFRPLNTRSVSSQANLLRVLGNTSCEDSIGLQEHNKSLAHRVSNMHFQEENSSKSTASGLSDRDLVIRIMSTHKPDVVVCPANKPFDEFVLENNIFP